MGKNGTVQLDRRNWPGWSAIGRCFHLEEGLTEMPVLSVVEPEAAISVFALTPARPVHLPLPAASRTD
jgi:hypothetical protein